MAIALLLLTKGIVNCGFTENAEFFSNRWKKMSKMWYIAQIPKLCPKEASRDTGSRLIEPEWYSAWATLLLSLKLCLKYQHIKQKSATLTWKSRQGWRRVSVQGFFLNRDQVFHTRTLTHSELPGMAYLSGGICLSSSWYLQLDN